jgi:uncharacterized protein (UPF0276 family)
MEAIGGHRCARGVGVAYHPFLHDYLLNRSALFDFIELPLDLYLDSARAALLDPGQRRLSQVAATGRCVWRGSALRLGTVERSGDARFAPHLLRRIRDLLQTVDAAHYTEAIVFRIANSGAEYALPFTPAAARWVAERRAAACDALEIPVLLALPDAAVPAPSTGMDAAAFLTLAASFGGAGFVVDAAEWGPAGAQDDVMARLPTGQIAAISVSGDNAATWEAASRLAGNVRPNSIVLRRDRQLFPLDTIERDLRRAASLIASPTAIRVASAAPAMGSEPDMGSGVAYLDGLAALHDYQLAMTTLQDSRAAASHSWQNWRTQVNDMHKAQQIMALTMRRDARHAPPRAL